jgi:1-acyl-sn-glycerol-3-phosphate acyltransferase
VFGRENLPANGGVLIASNHQSFLDPILIAVCLRRPVNFMARADLFRQALFSAWIRSLKAFPLQQGGSDTSGVREAMRRLRHGAQVLVFPEGTRSPDGRLGRLKDGFVTIAARSGARVLPAVIEGAYEAWPRGAALFVPRNVWVAFGRPLTPTVATGEERKAFSERVRCRMEELQTFLRRVRAGQSGAESGFAPVRGSADSAGPSSTTKEEAWR